MAGDLFFVFLVALCSVFSTVVFKSDLPPPPASCLAPWQNKQPGEQAGLPDASFVWRSEISEIYITLYYIARLYYYVKPM